MEGSIYKDRLNMTNHFSSSIDDSQYWNVSPEAQLRCDIQ